MSLLVDECRKTGAHSLATEIIAAYVKSNPVSVEELPAMINSVHATLHALAGSQLNPPSTFPRPVVPVRKSVTHDNIICLEDGKKFRLKRHLCSEHKMTPQQYRMKWGLPKDYPMVATSFSARRSELAKRIGLGRLTKRTRSRRAYIGE